MRVLRFRQLINNTRRLFLTTIREHFLRMMVHRLALIAKMKIEVVGLVEKHKEEQQCLRKKKPLLEKQEIRMTLWTVSLIA